MGQQFFHQVDTSSGTWQNIALFLWGNELPLDELKRIKLPQAPFVARKGEPNPRRFERQPNGLLIEHKGPACPADVCSWDVTQDNSRPFMEELEALIEALRPHKEMIRRILESAGSDGFLLCRFGSDECVAHTHFSAETFAFLGDLHLTMYLTLENPEANRLGNLT